MKFSRIIILILSGFIVVPVFSGCGSKKRVLLIDCPSEKPSEYNKEGFKNEKERAKTLERINKSRGKERK